MFWWIKSEMFTIAAAKKSETNWIERVRKCARERTELDGGSIWMESNFGWVQGYSVQNGPAPVKNDRYGCFGCVWHTHRPWHQQMLFYFVCLCFKMLLLLFFFACVTGDTHIFFLFEKNHRRHRESTKNLHMTAMYVCLLGFIFLNFRTTRTQLSLYSTCTA